MLQAGATGCLQAHVTALILKNALVNINRPAGQIHFHGSELENKHPLPHSSSAIVEVKSPHPPCPSSGKCKESLIVWWYAGVDQGQAISGATREEHGFTYVV